MARTSIRTSAPRNQPSSPPKRRTRSQSAELQPASQLPAPKRAGKRARQSSVESDQSDSSVQSISKRRKLGRRAVDHELSIVDEQPEHEREEVEDEEHQVQDGTWALTETSPLASQYSGTTAYTSHSQEQLRDMDATSLIDYLPELFNTTCALLDLLAPKKVSTQDTEELLEYVDGVLKDLKVPGSRLSQKLKRKEEVFQANREHYGATEFIDLRLIMRKLFDTPTPSDSEFRPDAILYAANLATAIKDILVKPKENQSTHLHLRGLEARFPQAFLSAFGKETSIGNSRLREKSFDLALDILTQAIIADLSHPQEDDGNAIEPDRILASSFYSSMPSSSLTMDELEDFYNSEPVFDILRHATNSNAQKAKIRKRVSNIRVAFRYTGGAIDNGDQVNFELLNDKYPWVNFIANMVAWSRLRLDELISSVEEQGGAPTIAEALEDILDVEATDFMVDLPKLQPAAEIKSSVEVAKYTKKPQLLQKLLKSKESNSSKLAHTGDRQSRISTDIISSSMSGPLGGQPAEFSGGESQDAEEDRRQSSSRALLAWERDTEERNKENLRSGAANSGKSKAFSSQHQVTVNRPSDDPERSNHKRPRDVIEDDDSDEEGFQSDSRFPNPSKRTKPSANRPAQVGRNSEDNTRQRIEPESEAEDGEEEGDIRHQNRFNDERAIQAVAQNAPKDDEELQSQRADDDAVPDSTQARATARVATARAKVARPQRVQTRKPWSQADEKQLVELIEHYGTSWAVIHQHADFEREETQVGIKDKARNLKVVFLKAGILEADLPINFDRIALGKKERRAVKTAQPHLFSDLDE